MPKLYFYSKTDLAFKSIGRGRLSAIVISLVMISSLLTMILGYFGIDLFGMESLRANSIARENSIMKAQLASLNSKLDGFKEVMEKLSSSDSQLRVSVNLPKIPPDTRRVAVGGVEENRDFGVSGNANQLISKATNTLEVLYREAKLQQSSYKRIMDQYKTNQRLFAHIPAIDPIANGEITDGFGMRMHPILHVMLMHEGIDIAADQGTDVHATGSGVVTYVGKRGGYGNVVEIDNGFGYSTLFGHLEKALVVEGQKVKRGQVIALTGDTGLSTGPHLHYEVIKDGVHVNPTEYFFNGRGYGTSGFYAELAQK